MTAIYELAILGDPSVSQVNELHDFISQAILDFGLRLNHEVTWEVCPTEFNPKQQKATAAVFFGGKNAPEANIQNLLDNSIPILPVVSDLSNINKEIPLALRSLNCIAYNEGGPERVATGLLECAGLLPRQRRVFLSYRRNEAREAAIQLFAILSSKYFDVFLDTHSIAPAEDFQSMLWHRLCDSDVLIMLDTPNYFESRWTTLEYGRAQAKNISILQILWPTTSPTPRTETATRFKLLNDDIDLNTGRLSEDVINRICTKLEYVRSQSHAIRNLSIVSSLRDSIKKIGGTITGIGPGRSIFIHLPDGDDIIIYPTIGVPTSTTLHEATLKSPNKHVAVLYDHIGLHKNSLMHIDWLGIHIKSAQFIKVAEAAWVLAIPEASV